MKALFWILIIAVTFSFGCGKKSDRDDDYGYYRDYDNDPYNPYNTSSYYPNFNNGYQTNGFIVCPGQTGQWQSQQVFSSCLNYQQAPGVIHDGNLYNPQYFMQEILNQYYQYGYGMDFQSWFCQYHGNHNFYQGNMGYAGGFCGSSGVFQGVNNASYGQPYNGYYSGGSFHFSW